MPYISLSVSVPISEHKKHVLQQQIGSLITIIPGKTPEGTMIKIEDCCDIFMGGASAKAAFCEIRLLGSAPVQNKAELYEKIYNLLTDQLDIEKLYFNYSVFEEWGSGDTFRTL